MKKKHILICVTLFTLFILIMLIVILNKSTGIDEKVYQFIRSFSSEKMDKYFVFITKLGNTITIFGIVLIIAVICRNYISVFLTTTTIVSAASNTIIKHILKRERPANLKLINQGGYSFPSGHAMISIAVYGALLYLIIKRVKNKALKIILSIILIFIIINIGISRIYVGVHYPTDVIAGYLLALIELIIIINIFNGRGYLDEKDRI